ncbi:MAG: hypothetical protein NC041_02460 [Bacteroides sp.]|nr:hypothetical protein [Treponema brennaborense]MCM1469316.1 hypothetical protein [Bacteroides sp.]
MKKTTRIAALLAAAALIFGNLFFSCSIGTESDGSPNPDPVVENVNINGVWTYTQGGETSYVYADETTVYEAVKVRDSYNYSKANDAAVWGTYTVRGNTVAIALTALRGEEYTCTVSGDSFTLNMGESIGEITLKKVPGAKATCAAIDADITGVWTYTQDEKTLYFYAENDTLYTAAESSGRYIYSKGDRYVWATYSVRGNTVIMDRYGEEYTFTLKDNTLTHNAGNITLTKVPGAKAACVVIDADITGVWTCVQGGAISYAYADETTVYEAVKVRDNYCYSKANAAVLGTYTIIGDTVTMNMDGEEYTSTVSGDSFVLNMGGTIGKIMLTKVPGAKATCAAMDMDITGVWTYTQRGKTSYLYAEDNVFYTAIEANGSYYYSKADTGVWGDYTVIGDTVVMEIGIRKYTCTISGDSFTLNIGGTIGNITLTKVPGAKATCAAIDADISGVWTCMQDEKTLYFYAENDTLYMAAESSGRYIYSKGDRYVWATYSVRGNTVIMDRYGEEYTFTLKDNTLTHNAGNITLTKVPGAKATCVSGD